MSSVLINQICGVYRYEPKCDEWHAPRNRKMHYIAYQQSGEYIHRLKDKTLISKTDSVIFLNRNDEYWVTTNTHGKSINMGICLDMDIESTTIACQDTPDIEGLFLKALKLYNSVDESKRFLCLSYIYEILSFVVNASHEYIDPKNSNVIANIQNYIDQNVSARITNAELARIGNFSERTLTDLFRKKYGLTPTQYVLAKRLSLAKELLSSGAHEINQISFICGFDDPSYFSRIFKQKIGVSPRDYMNRERYNVPVISERKGSNLS